MAWRFCRPWILPKEAERRPATVRERNLSSWWPKIVTGLLLFALIGFQQSLARFAKRLAALTAGAVP